MSDLTNHEALHHNLLGRLIDADEQRAPFETRWPALAGALVGLSAATRNAFAVRINERNLVPLNLYVALIGQTGGGKDSALRFAEAIAAEGGVKPTGFSSDVALHRALATERKGDGDPKTRLVLWDEFGHALQQLKADRGGHQRGMLTKLMEVRGLALNGVLPERRYADRKQDLPEVRSPYVCALFATTPSTLHDALTSAEVVDGSLNSMLILYLDDDAPLRELGLRPRFKAVDDAEPQGPYGIVPIERIELPGASRRIGENSFHLIEVAPKAFQLLQDFRRTAEERRRGDGRFGPLWARAFENSVKIAGLSALGVCLEDPKCAPKIRVEDSLWGIALVEHSIEGVTGDLRDHLADTESQKIQNAIMRKLKQLTIAALNNTNPDAENTASAPAREKILQLKRAGFVTRKDLINPVEGAGRSSRDVYSELKTLVDARAVEMFSVEWKTGTGAKQVRELYTYNGSAQD